MSRHEYEHFDGIPSGDAIRSADAMQAKTLRGICIGTEKCERLSDDEDGLCSDHRKEA